MKKNIISLLFLIASQISSAQILYLKISGQNDKETRIIDSLGYQSKHQNAKSLIEENNQFSNRLSKIGFLNSRVVENFKTNDSTFYFLYDIDQKTKWIHMYIEKENQKKIPALYPIKNDSITINYEECETFLSSTLKKMENEGYSMAKVKLINIKKSENTLNATLSITTETKRKLNDIVINRYDKFPAGYKKNINRNYRNKTFNQKTLNDLYKDFGKFRFVNQTKYPEILFTKDSTKAYVYLEKAKANSFDGLIGFANGENKKIIFSGYLDLVLNNILNSGETFTLDWKSNGLQQKTFNLGLEMPFIFKSPLGIKAQLNIFKQDSTFQNAKTAFDLGYYFKSNKRLFLGYQSTESSDIQNTNSLTISDYNNSFLTGGFEFTDFKNDDLLFPEKTKLYLKIGSGNRETQNFTDKQFFGNLLFRYNFYLNEKNIINFRAQNYFLSSTHYIINELERFGGINSIRGFYENSLQANVFASVQTEYRYVLSPNLYLHSIIDYGFIQDKTTNSEDRLLGLGFGLGLLTKNGLLNIVYANGSSENQSTTLANSIIHISLKTSF